MQNSKISWPTKDLMAVPEMTYESIVLLYNEVQPHVFGDQMAFALSCSRHFYDTKGCRGCVHKLDVAAAPDFASAKMAITHEVLPDEGASSQIINVHDTLRVACFDRGVIIPIKNFGPKKTFNCDVRAGLRHHCSPINTLASNQLGSQLASGSTGGEVALYRVQDEEIEFLSRANVSSVIITGLVFVKPVAGAAHKRRGDSTPDDGESMLIYSTGNGHIGLIDARCKQGAQMDFMIMHTTEPRLNISSLCLVNKSSCPQLFFGTKHGHLNSLDLRNFKKYLYEQKLYGDGCVRRMKEIVVQDEKKENLTFIAYTNSTNELRILNTATMKTDDRWVCDRTSEGAIQDFCQVGKRIVTCGNKTAIGCWVWEGERT